MKFDKTQKKDRILASLFLASALIVVLGLSFIVGKKILAFVSEPEKFHAWVEARGAIGRLAYVGMVFLQVVAAVIPGEPLEIAGGYAFGAFEGTLLCTLGAFLGSIAVFALVRKWGIRFARLFVSEKKLAAIRFLGNSEKRYFLFLLVFILPGTPKDLLCYFAGLTDVKLWVWLLLCSVGRLPSIITSTVGGSALGLKNYQFALMSFGVALALALIGFLCYGLICRKHRK